MKYFKNIFAVVMVILMLTILVILCTICFRMLSTISGQAFNANVIHEEVPNYTSCDVYFSWVVRYANVGDEKKYTLFIDFGDGNTDTRDLIMLVNRVRIESDVGRMFYSYHLNPGESRMMNVTFKFIHPDPDIPPIIKKFAILIKTKN